MAVLPTSTVHAVVEMTTQIARKEAASKRSRLARMPQHDNQRTLKSLVHCVALGECNSKRVDCLCEGRNFGVTEVAARGYRTSVAH